MPLELDPLRIYLDYDESQVPDISKSDIKCLPGCVAVEMLTVSEKIGSLYLPQRAKQTYHDDDDPVAGFEPSLGIVLDCGGPGLQKGQIVIVRDGDGLEISEGRFGDYRSSGPVRFFGLVVPDGMGDGYVEDLPWEESILATYDNKVIRPLGRNVLLKRDEAVREISGFLLPDVVSDGPTEATVEAVGELVRGCKPGDRVLYHPLATLDFYDAENKNRRMVREKAIFAVI